MTRLSRHEAVAGRNTSPYGPPGVVEDTALLVAADSPPTVGPVSESDCEPALVDHVTTFRPTPEAPPETSDAFYRQLVQSMRNGVLAIRRDGIVAVINELAYRTLGLADDHSCVGLHYKDLLGPHHPFSEVFAEAFDMATLPNRSEVRLDTTGQVLGFTLSRIADASQRVTGAVLYFKDLTRVEQLEERERLRDRLTALGEMAAAIAHEVKNPLASIQVMAGLLKRRASMSNDDQAVLTDIIGEAQVANKIVVDLLEFVRPINLQIELVSVSTVLHTTALKHEEAAGHDGVTVTVEIHGTLPCVRGDHTQLRQLVTNLLVNASEALDGHGHVTVTARFVPVDADTVLTGEPNETIGSVIVDVADDGPGIPDDVIGKIFSPFFTTKPCGSGLGLAIVRKIVDAHDGRIDVQRRATGSTRFRVTLPVTHEATSRHARDRSNSLSSSAADCALSENSTRR